MSTDEGGWRWQEAIIRRAFPGIQITSAFRNNSVANGSGSLDYHSRGRAIDLPPMPSVFTWLVTNYPQSQEIIFSPMGAKQIWNGQPHVYGEPTKSDHYNHVHWAIIGGTNPDGSDGPQPGQGGSGIALASFTTADNKNTDNFNTFEAIGAWTSAAVTRGAAGIAGAAMIYYGLKRAGGIP
jgi:hypothetical protein